MAASSTSRVATTTENSAVDEEEVNAFSPISKLEVNFAISKNFLNFTMKFIVGERSYTWRPEEAHGKWISHSRVDCICLEKKSDTDKGNF